jgi:RND family efflux transporter MFP subunit
MRVRLLSPPRALAAAVLAAALGAGAACGGHASAADATTTPTVAVARITRRPLDRTLVITAELRPYQDVDVHAKVAGFVKDINVDVGSRVKRGDVLATLEIPELADDVQQADAAVGASTSEVTRAEAEVTRSGSAHDVAHLAATRLANVSKSQPGLVAQQEIDDATGRDKIAEAQLATASAALDAARQQLAVAKANQARTQALFDYARITAPFDGIVTKRYADQGTMIQAGTSSTTQALPLVRLAQDDRLRLVMPVPESAVSSIHDGGAVEVRVPSLQRSFSGTIARSANQVDPTTRTMHVEVDVPNPGGTLVPGLYAEATVVLEHLADAVAVPMQAIDRADTGTSVMVVTPAGVLLRRPVTLGLETVDAAQVLSGLSPGDQVVVGARSQLRVGDHVQPKAEEPTAAGAK